MISTREKLILIVEDYKDTRDMYAEFLRRAGFRVSLSSNGAEAIETACELLPDLIVMDLSMPGMDGAQANVRLKANARTSGIPVLLLTAFELEHLTEEVAEAGFSGLLRKPCMPNELIAAIHRTLGE